MSHEETLAAPRSLWALQLVAAIIVADAIFSVVQAGTITLLLSGPSEVFGQMGAVFNSLQIYYAVLPLLMSAALFYASGLSPARGLLRAAAGTNLVIPALGVVWLLSGWLEWLSPASSLSTVLSWTYQVAALSSRLLIIAACARLAKGALEWEVIKAAVFVVAASLFVIVTRHVPGWLEFGVEHPWLTFAVRTGVHLTWVGVVALLILRTGKLFDSGGIGSWSRAHRGLERYRQAVLWRIALAVSLALFGIALGSATSVSALRLWLLLAGAVTVVVSIHGARGLYGFAHLPQIARATFTSQVAFVLMLGVLCFNGVALALAPTLFSATPSGAEASGFVTAIFTISALSNLANLVGLASVLGVLISVSRVAGCLHNEELARSARGLIVTVIGCAAAILFIEFGRGGGDGEVFVSALAAVAAIVALIWYVKLLGRASAAIAAHDSVEQPLAVARRLARGA